MYDLKIRAAAAAAACILVITPALASAQGAPPQAHEDAPVANAVRATGAILVDGRLDDAAWQSASPVATFTQIDPQEGAPASQATEVRLVYDDEALYIGVRMTEPGGVSSRLGRRDMPLGDSDWFGVALDSYHDHRTAYVFQVNPGGVRRDLVRTSSGTEERDDASWDPVWDVATSVDAQGWIAEYRIPFAQLRFNPGDRQVWGLQLERIIGSIAEDAVFAFTPKRERGGIARYGHLLGLEAILTGKRLELLPYVVARGEYVDNAFNPYRDGSENTASAGLDLKYRLTSDLTLDATINPDFGQVEVDPAVINLGVYETRFAEKRPFFIEGSEIFQFGSGGGGELFYTRRIGRMPQLAPPSPLADVPPATTILGAAKLSGKTSSGWSVGVVEAMTAEEDARFRDADGADREFIVEPFTNYFVGRARREMRAGQSTIGGIFTAVNRNLSSPAARGLLRSSAYAGGIDFRHEWANRAWALNGSLSVSRVAGEPSAVIAVQTAPNHYFQRPDADHLEVDTTATSLTGLAAFISLARQAGEHWRGGLSLATTTPEYEINDLGFSYRTDRRDAEALVVYNENQPGSFFRNYGISARARFEGNYAGQLIANWLTLTGIFRHLSYNTVFLSFNHSLRANDDRLTRGGPIAVRPAYSSAGIDFVSDERKPVTFGLHLGGQRDEFDGWFAGVGFNIGLKTSQSWNLTVGPSFTRSYTVAQYVTTFSEPGFANTFDKRYVFAPLDFTQLAIETRLNYSFNPHLSLQVYAQPLLSSGDYGDLKSLDRPGTYDFSPFTGPAPDLDFNLRSLRGNAVLRWEWRAGSTLYLAWQQSRSDYVPGLGEFDFSRDERALFNTAPDNIFVLKINYWINP